MLWSGDHLEPLLSNLIFRLVSEYFGFRDLNQPSPLSKVAYVFGQARKEAKMSDFGGQ